MANYEKPRLHMTFTWEDGEGINEYAYSASVPEPLTTESLEQAAVNIAGLIGKLLIMEGVILSSDPGQEQKQ